MSNFVSVPNALPFGKADSKHKAAIARIWEHRNLFLAFLDVLTIFAAVFIAYYLRFFAELMAIKIVPTPSLSPYIQCAAILCTIWIVLLWRDGAYQSEFGEIETPILKIKSITTNGFYAMGGLMAISFMDRAMLLSRQVYLMTFVLACCGMVVHRLAFNWADRLAAKRGILCKRVVIVGLNNSAGHLGQVFKDYEGSITTVGHMSWSSDEKSSDEKIVVLGNINNIKEVFEMLRFDTLIIFEPLQKENEISSLADFMSVLNFCEEKNLSVYMIPNSYSVSVTQREVGSLAGMPLVHLKDASLNKAFACIKRFVDLCISVIVILLGLPIWLLIAILIKSTSRGPVLYSQIRAGLHGKPFKMYKFRSMIFDAEKRLSDLVDINSLKEPVFKIKDDPRITSVGKFLRRTSLDEIPQVYNVLKGEMSLVGPRPEEMALVERYEPLQRRRLKAKPGITGYQQVHNRGGASLEERIKYDLFYLKHQSLLLDIYIIMKTAIVIIRGDGITH